MDTIKVENATIKSKQVNTIPKGATILRKDVRTTVEEIENGFIVEKNYDIKYKLKDTTDYMYFSKKVFTEENPIKIEEDKRLADYFD